MGLILFFLFTRMQLGKTQAMLMQILSTLKAKPQKHIMFGNFFQLQILLIQRKADPRMLVAARQEARQEALWRSAQRKVWP